MQAVFAESADVDLFQTGSFGAVCVGWIVQLTEDGQAVVDFPDNSDGPIKARSVLTAPALAQSEGPVGLPVLLAFEDGDLSLPIILGVIRTTLYPQTPRPKALLAGPKQQYVAVDGKKIVLDGQEEVVLRCGQSSISLRKDGKIIIKGTDLTSRASRTNKIKGGAVKIN
jgi:hypothetical protein